MVTQPHGADICQCDEARVTDTHLIQQQQSIDHNLVRTSNTHFVRHQGRAYC